MHMFVELLACLCVFKCEAGTSFFLLSLRSLGSVINYGVLQTL